MTTLDEIAELIDARQDYELAAALTREQLVRLATALGVRSTGPKLAIAVEIKLEIANRRARTN